MSKLDKKLILEKLRELRDYIKKLEEFRDMDKPKFINDYHHYGLAEHYMRLSVEVVLDISRHIVLALDLKMPEEARGLLPLLAQAKVLSEDFVERNQEISGFRNRLVHVYSGIDHEKTYEYLQEHFADFREFSKQISTYLLNQPEIQ